MNADQPDFEALRRLLKLKRHEQPPPRYFNDFSTRVISRLKAGTAEAGGGVLTGRLWELSWAQRFLAAFQNKPVFAGALGVMICALVVAGAIYSERLEFSSPVPELAIGQPPAGMAPVSVFGNDSAFAFNSTNPVTPPTGSSIFDAFKVNAMPVSYRPGGN